MNELQLITSEKLQILDIYAQNILKSGIVPHGLNTVEKVKVVLLSGYEMGMSPMRSLNKLFVVQGRAAQTAENMLALIRERLPTFDLEVLQSDEQACKIKATRDGKRWETFEWTADQAKAAGLLNKENWAKYRPDMLWARCIARMARRLAPDILGGVSYVPEELDPSLAVDSSGSPGSSYSGAGAVENERTQNLQAGLENLKDVTATERIEALPGATAAVPAAPAVAPETTKEWANKKAAEAKAKVAEKTEKKSTKATKKEKPSKTVAENLTGQKQPIAEEELPAGPETIVDTGEFPAPGDHEEPPKETLIETMDDYGNYKMPVGPLAGKTLKELGGKKVNELAQKTLKAVADMNPKDVKQHTLDFLHAAECWLEEFVAQGGDLTK